MSLNLNRLKKADILKMFNYRCEHGHNGLEHPSCFKKNYPEAYNMIYGRMCWFDIEATGVDNAEFDIMISYSILDEDGNVLGRTIREDEIRDWHVFDKALVKDCIKDLDKYDTIVCYYSGDYRYDLPFLRTRALVNNLEFFKWKDKIIIDVYSLVKAKLKLHRNRLENACSALHIPAKQHKLDEMMWMRAKFCADGEALKYIKIHNEEDCLSLKELYERLCEFKGNTKTSI